MAKRKTRATRKASLKAQVWQEAGQGPKAGSSGKKGYRLALREKWRLGARLLADAWPRGRRTAKPRVPRVSTARPASGSARRGPAPGLQRPRRILDDNVPTPPSSLDLDRHASAANSGRAEILEALRAHTESSPALTGGDVDADWAKAYDSGDEAPGGDNPTPDQDIVDEIGRSLGIQYEDVEELKGADKVTQRDRHRWELDPASSEDYPDRRKR